MNDKIIDRIFPENPLAILGPPFNEDPRMPENRKKGSSN
jgi:hypothetical protein